MFGIGIKGPSPELTLDRLPRIRREHEHWGENRIVDFGPIRMSLRHLWRETLRYSVVSARRRLARRGSDEDDDGSGSGRGGQSAPGTQARRSGS